jgi:hypothetical protein
VDVHRSGLVLTIIAMLAASAAPAEAKTTPPTCSANETEIFSCTAGKRTVAVCMSDGGRVYRSFRDEALEIQIPGGSPMWFGYSGGGEHQIAFRNRDVDYVVYQRTVRTSFGDRHDVAIDAGVTVARGGKTISTVHCDSPDTTFSVMGEPATAADAGAPGR